MPSSAGERKLSAPLQRDRMPLRYGSLCTKQHGIAPHKTGLCSQCREEPASHVN